MIRCYTYIHAVFFILSIFGYLILSGLLSKKGIKIRTYLGFLFFRNNILPIPRYNYEGMK